MALTTWDASNVTPETVIFVEQNAAATGGPVVFLEWYWRLPWFQVVGYFPASSRRWLRSTFDEKGIDVWK